MKNSKKAKIIGIIAFTVAIFWAIKKYDWQFVFIILIFIFASNMENLRDRYQQEENDREERRAAMEFLKKLKKKKDEHNNRT